MHHVLKLEIMSTTIYRYKDIIVGIDMEKWQPNLMCLNTHLKISFSREKLVEMHR